MGERKKQNAMMKTMNDGQKFTIFLEFVWICVTILAGVNSPEPAYQFEKKIVTTHGSGSWNGTIKDEEEINHGKTTFCWRSFPCLCSGCCVGSDLDLTCIP